MGHNVFSHVAVVCAETAAVRFFMGSKSVLHFLLKGIHRFPEQVSRRRHQLAHGQAAVGIDDTMQPGRLARNQPALFFQTFQGYLPQVPLIVFFQPSQQRIVFFAVEIGAEYAQDFRGVFFRKERGGSDRSLSSGTPRSSSSE